MKKNLKVLITAMVVVVFSLVSYSSVSAQTDNSAHYSTSEKQIIKDLGQIYEAYRGRPVSIAKVEYLMSPTQEMLDRWVAIVDRADLRSKSDLNMEAFDAYIDELRVFIDQKENGK